MYRVDSEQNYDSVYCLPNGTLKNKFGITNKEILDVYANGHAAFRKAQLDSLCSRSISIKEGSWNTDMLKDIHKALMGDVYDWAGEYRTVDVGISYDHVAYENPANISKKLEDVFNYINKKNCLKDEDYISQLKDLALVFGMLKVLQPFRDGNTRTAITFTQLLAMECGLVVDFNFFGNNERIEVLREAQVKARDNDFNPLVYCFCMMVAPVEERPELAMPRVELGKQGNLYELLKSLEDSEGGRKKIQHKAHTGRHE